MKKTLLAAALAMVALGASAQAQEVAKVKGNGFRFLGKNLATEGKIIPYSTIGADYYGSKDVTEAEFTIYDEAFNKVKSFTYPFNTYKYTRTPMTALAEITKKTFIQNWDNWPVELGKDSVFNTMDEFKKFVLENDPDVAADYFFIDHNGNFAFEDHRHGWIEDNGTQYIDDKEIPTIRQHYYYYNKDEKAIYRCTAILAVECDIDNAAFVVDSSRSPEEESYRERVTTTEVYDYDLGCYEDSYGYLTQNVFNKDDQFEFIVDTYKEVAVPTDENTSFSNGLKYAGVVDGKIKINKWVQDKYYESYEKVVNESGQELIKLPNSSKGLSLYRINGKTYIETYERDSSTNEYMYVIYLLDGTGTGITELARTKAVKGAPTFNLQGMKVNKDAKGIVIQKGGAKYLNK